MEQRLSFITLGVGDLDRAANFYRRLGWTPAKMGEGQGVVFFQLGGIVLALWPREELAADAGVEQGSVGFSGVSISYNARSREEADAVMAQAIAAGAIQTKPLQQVSWGGYAGYFADPEGHLWEVVHNPKARIAKDGSVHID